MADSNTKRKILFLIDSLSETGAAQVLTTLVQYIDKTKFDVTVCAINGGGKYEAMIKEEANYKVILTGSGFRNNLVNKWQSLSWVYKFYVPKDSDVEIAYTEGLATKLLSHSSNKKAKKIAWIHSDLTKNHWSKEFYKDLAEETKVYNQFDRIIGVSENIVSAFRSTLPQVNVPVETIYNPIDSLSIRVKSFALADDVNQTKTFRLVTIGRLEPQKGYDRLLRVVNRLIGENYDIELWILGDGADRGILQRYIKSNNLQDRIKLMGYHQNPYKYLTQGNLFVCSSLSEGYSTAVTEALILGLPVVTTDCSGMAELLKGGECGLITRNTEDALYEGIKKLLNDPELLEQYKQKAETRGWDFDIEALMVPIEKLLAE